jgi:hypothetical protein
MDFLMSVFQNILSGYIILVIIKFIGFREIHKFMGDYSHFPLNNDQIIFTLSYNKWNMFNPILNISIKIARHNKQEKDTQDWSGTFNSDILNAYYFKGQYIIKEPSIGDKDGWLEIYLFKKKANKLIAFSLHYLDDKKRWVADEGYYIEKKEIE